MTTLTKIIVSTLFTFLLFSCDFNMNLSPGISGNGNVVTVDRTVEGNFNKIEVSRGMDVYLTQSDTETIEVEADENLQDIIVTEIKDNVLKIYADQNIRQSKSQKVFVNFRSVSSISSSSGSDVYSTNTIAAESLELSTSSGSDMELNVNTERINCSSSSGSDLKLSGKTNTLYAEASSGSDIKAGSLDAVTSHVKASSGADITVNTSKELIAKASSGGDIKYYGNPEKIDKSDGVSGSISKQ
ncbi:putative autotransporter adhesin-like protein [Flavobacteriaceae bacterium MAR_2010_72]|nr:putative autotransporter adhesin-like protein [Flavobacteriaceae bacterium MAR_2010_72]TVZ60234.1 putative autotransporter adhesin-like protein [Flavobacteriaceae bacterium MAR_2010_105]